MTKSLTDASTFSTAITPVNQEQVTEALLESCFQALANRTRYLLDNIGASGPALATNQVYGRSSSGAAGGKTTSDFSFTLLALANAVAHADALHTKGSDIASATTTNIAGASGLYVHITGTTTITSFGSAGAGVFRYIRFADVLTLTHNATSLVLPGDANITTDANDTAIAVSEGAGNWRVIAYQRASGVALVGNNDFLLLSDTPGSFSGHAGKLAQVNAGETALEFAQPRVFPVVGVGWNQKTLSGLSFQGGTLAEGEYVAMAGQTDPIENGIYAVSSGAWTRVAPWDTAAGFQNGQIFVASGVSAGSFTTGTAQAVVVTTVPGTVGSDPIEFQDLVLSWRDMSSLNFGIPISGDTITANGPADANGMIADFDNGTGAVGLPSLDDTARDGLSSPSTGAAIYNPDSDQLEVHHGGGNWNPHFDTLRVGDGASASQTGALDIEVSGPVSTPLIHVENSTTAADFDVSGGSAVPSHSAPAGSLYVRSTGSGNASLYQNKSVTSPGTTWSLLSSAVASLPTGYADFAFSYVSATTVRIGPGSCRSDDDTEDMVWAGNLDVVITSSGAGGLDSGSIEKTDQWYRVYVISNGTPAAIGVEEGLTLSLPGGYTVSRFAGWFRNDGSGDVLRFKTVGKGRSRRCYYNVLPSSRQVLSGGSATGNTAIDISAFVPPDSVVRNVALEAAYSNTSGGGFTLWTLGTQLGYTFDCESNVNDVLVEFPLENEATDINYRFVNASGSADVFVHFWEYEL